MTPKPHKPKKCKAKGCGIAFTPARMGQSACSPTCALTVARAKREQDQASKARAERLADKEKRDKLKTRGDWIKEAQVAFNRYVRLRDAGKPCICCGRPLEGGAIGGGFDAGHYRSVGSAPHLRFDERNVHGQTKQCNRYGAGRAVDYRIGLIARIGREAVEELEADQRPRKHSIDDLIEIRNTYRAKAKEIDG